MKKFKLIIVTTLVLLASLSANTPLTGTQIIEKSYNRPTSKDQAAILTMTLTNKNGQTRVRKIQQFSKDLGDKEKNIMFFVSPADVKNTSFMNWTYNSDKSDDQWIYLPALKKIKRISSDSKSNYFMGSDFTYDDLGDRKINADIHTLLREESLNDKECYVIESKSQDEDYMYSKTITWIDKETFIGMKKEFYDEDAELLKILEVKKVEKFSDLYIITHSEMKNVQKDHSTTITLNNVNINSGISEDKFTERMMTRGI
ncbi:MAG: outer membrane lipoprotein-sorting protein [Candidatus Marinimicrobia bacterium]|nr:outer membrane lipoprotein-sorting protein [Candidatus Neomarinimicrobiota bacterium]